jgi:WD40 repeat protein
MPRIFMSHSSRDNRQAIALRQWLIEQSPALDDEIFLDLHHDSGIGAGVRWKDALRQASTRCEAVICLLSANWEASPECRTEYRFAEYLNKRIFSARIGPSEAPDPTREWQQIDLVGEGPTTGIDLRDGGPPVVFLSDGLHRLQKGIVGAGIGAETFVWPPPNDPQRAPYRGWEPLEEVDAAVFFGRDAQILRGLDALRGMRRSGLETLFVVLGPSGTGKSSFLRAGLSPRLRRDDTEFVLLDIVRPQRNVLTGDTGLARAIHSTRTRLGLTKPQLGAIKQACLAGDAAQLREWLVEMQRAASARLLIEAGQALLPTPVLPVDQAEELFGADAGEEARRFLELIAALSARQGLIVALTIRTDRYQALQTDPLLTGVDSVVFDELKPMPRTQFLQVITGPATRAAAGGHPLRIEPTLVQRLLDDCTEGADTLPLLALTLARLYEDYAGGGSADGGQTPTLTVDDYAAMGGIKSVVHTEIDRLLAADPDQRAGELALLRAAFVPWLATVNPDNDQPMRRLARWDDLPETSRPLLERLVARRLLIKDRRDGVVVVEVALESLLRQWDDLAAWLAEERDDLKATDTLERGAAEWDKNHRDDAWLLHGTRLADAENLAAKPGFRDRLNPTRDYLHASRQRENEGAELEKQRQQAELQAAKKLAATETQARQQAQESAAALRKRSRILRAVLAGTAIVALVAVIGFVQASRAEHRATRAARDALAAQLDTDAATVFSRIAFAGGDTHALADTLAAYRLRSDPTASRGAFYTATTALNTTRTIIPTPAPVHTVAVSPDGHTLASGSIDHTIRLWNLTDPAHPAPLGQPLTGHTDAVIDVTFSPDGHTLASSSDDHTIRLWNLTDPAHPAPLSRPLTGHTDTVVSVAFSPDGHTLASGSFDDTIRLWNLTDPAHPGPLGQPLQGHSGEVESVAFSPDGHTLASGSVDHTVRLWNLTDPAHPGPLGQPLQGHTDTVWSVAFSPDGHTLASSSADNTVRLWNLTDPAHPGPLGQPLQGHTDTVLSLAFSPDGHTLASSSTDGTVQLWNLTDPTHPAPLGLPLQGHTETVWDMAFSPDGHTLASGSGDRTIRLWNLDTALPLRGHTSAVYRVAFSPDGHTLASSSTDHTIRLWNLTDPTHPAPLGQPLQGHTDTVESVAFSPDGHTLASSSGDHTIRLWNLTDPTHPAPLGQPLQGHTDTVENVAFSPDGHTLASSSADHTIRLWNLTDPTHPAPLGQPLQGHTTTVWTVAFSPDGHTLASGGGLVTGGGDNTVRLWNLTDPAHPAPLGQPLQGHTGIVWSVAFSPDGHTLASGSGDHTVRLWDLTDPTHPRPVGQPLQGHAGTVWSVAFSPDGHSLASGSSDGTLRLWNLTDPAHPAPLGQPLQGHTDTVWSVAFSPDGHTLASGSADGTVRLWPTPLDATPSDATVATLCSKLMSNISNHDWRNWISPTIGYITLCPGLPIVE